MPSIGESLREARLSRGLTYEYISQIIKIRPEFLQALEEENYSALPGSFYAKNFLRRYADFLGLDAASLVERFMVAERAPSEQVTQAFAVSEGAASTDASPKRKMNYGLAGAMILLLIAVGVLLYQAFNGSTVGINRSQANIPPTGTAGSSALVAEATKPGRAVVPPPAGTTPTRQMASTATPTRKVAAKSASTPTATNTPKHKRKATRKPKTARVSGATKPSKATRTPKPTATPTPTNTATPRPTRTPTPTNTPRPTKTPTPTNTPKPTNTPTPQPTDTPVPTNTPEPTNTPTPKPTATATPVPQAKGAITARIRTTRPSHIIVKTDGRTVYDGVLKPGQVKSYGANAVLYIWGKPSPYVRVSINDCAEHVLNWYDCPNCQYAYYNFARDYRSCR